MKAIKQEHLIAGVDEAGRGPLAGPVIAAAVILHPHQRIDGLADSKVLTEKARDKIFQLIRTKALAWAVARGTVGEIDSINILQATFLAMQRAVKRLPIKPNLALIDGNASPVFECAAKTIIKGDATEPAISAASIIAKVLRDRLMLMLDKKYPLYGFAKHKGYGTAQHLMALKLYGPTRIHRKSFAPVTELLPLIPSQERTGS